MFSLFVYGNRRSAASKTKSSDKAAIRKVVKAEKSCEDSFREDVSEDDGD